jgi:protein-S-isoprenylcysteine O-methyltransferase Ste14
MTKNVDSLKMVQKSGHTDREDLAQEHPLGDSGQIVALIIFLIVWLLDSFLFKVSTILATYVPLYVRLIFAALLFILAGYFARSAHVVLFKEVREPPRVINTGVFAHMRHPLYCSVLLLYLGLISTTLSLFSMVLLVGIFVFYDYIATFEEKQLEEKFGQAYKDYKKGTPKWIPFGKGEDK